MWIRICAAFAAATAATLMVAPAANGFVYWGNRESGNVGRANLDGSASNPAFIRLPPDVGPSPCGIAVNDSHIYWADINNDEIGRANLDGTGVDANFINTSGTGDGPCGLAIDDTYIYWSTKDVPGGVGRALLNGSSPQTLVTTPKEACGVAVDSAHVYWGDANSVAVGRADLDGSNANGNFIPLSDFVNCGVAVDATHIYFSTQGPFGDIGRADLNGGNLKENFAIGDSPCGVAVNAGSIFWPEEIDETVARADIGGGNIDLGFIGGADFPCGVAVDSLSSPECQDESASTGHDQTVPLALQCTGTDPLTYAIASQPHNGRIDAFNPSTGAASYVPDGGFAGVDTFTYRATNPYGSSSDAMATVRVAPAPVPSNSFTLAGVRRHKRNGTATLLVSVPGPGRVSLGGRGVTPASDDTIEAASVAVPIRTRGARHTRLLRRGSLRVGVSVAFTPLGGNPAETNATVRLVRRR